MATPEPEMVQIQRMVTLSEAQQQLVRRYGNRTLDEVQVTILRPKERPPQGIGYVVVTSRRDPLSRSNTGEMEAYAGAAARTDWVLVAVDAFPAPKQDTLLYRRALLQVAQKEVHQEIAASDSIPHVLLGFSGGAKAAQVLAGMALADGLQLDGLFLGGCNEDLSRRGLRTAQKAKAAYQNLIVVYSHGLTDPIATPQRVKKVLRGFERRGWHDLTVLTHPGRHHHYPPHVEAAFRQFQKD